MIKMKSDLSTCIHVNSIAEELALKPIVSTAQFQPFRHRSIAQAMGISFLWARKVDDLNRPVPPVHTPGAQPSNRILRYSVAGAWTHIYQLIYLLARSAITLATKCSI